MALTDPILELVTDILTRETMDPAAALGAIDQAVAVKQVVCLESIAASLETIAAAQPTVVTVGDFDWPRGAEVTS